jgi:IS5 family transposase
MEQKTFFGENEKLQLLSKLGDPLEKLNSSVNWTLFANELKELLYKESNGLGGRPSYDYLLMFKIVILQQIYNISDDKTEYQINDRLSFQRFLGLSIDSTIPDAKTIWAFKEKLTQSQNGKTLFNRFNKYLKACGLILQKGSIVDASIIEKPRKHTDTYDDGAGWTKKGDQTYYGYKNNIKADKDSKVIIEFSAMAANICDNQAIAGLIDKNDKEIYADKGYAGQNIERAILEKNKFVKIKILKKASKKRKLTDKDLKDNAIKSKIRVRVEHIFGHMKQAMNGTYIRCKSLARAITNITLKNLAYNLQRFAFLRDKWVITA